MEVTFKALRLGFFAETVLSRLSQVDQELLLPSLQEADERLAALEAATPAPLADAELAELVKASKWLDEENDLLGTAESLLVIIRNGTVPGPGEEEQSVLECFLELSARLRRLEALRNALPGLLARLAAAEVKAKEVQLAAETLAYQALDSLLYTIPRGLKPQMARVEDAAKKVLLAGGSGIGAEVVRQMEVKGGQQGA